MTKSRLFCRSWDLHKPVQWVVPTYGARRNTIFSTINRNKLLLSFQAILDWSGFNLTTYDCYLIFLYDMNCGKLWPKVVLLSPKSYNACHHLEASRFWWYRLRAFAPSQIRCFILVRITERLGTNLRSLDPPILTHQQNLDPPKWDYYNWIIIGSSKMGHPIKFRPSNMGPLLLDHPNWDWGIS